MTANRVMKLWTAVITAFLAVLAALGLASSATAATAVQQVRTSCNDNAATVSITWPTRDLWSAVHKRSLPPTMKQRIHAEAHGSSPSCRRLPSRDTEADAVAVAVADDAGAATEAAATGSTGPS